MLTNYRKNDKQGHDELYKATTSSLLRINNVNDYIKEFEITKITPYGKGGCGKGYVRGLAVRELIKAADATGRERKHLTVLDAGCGVGELSTYLACKGFSVLGVDISSEGCRSAEKLVAQVGQQDHCIFLPESLESMSIADSSVDFIIGHGALHHFIKYEGIPAEFKRVMKDGAKGFFADSFGENVLYHLFHNKESMERLGDVILTKKLVTGYFRDFSVELVPTDWFVMLDKLYKRFLPKNLEQFRRKMSRLHFEIDRKIPYANRIALFLSGAVMTSIQNIPR